MSLFNKCLTITSREDDKCLYESRNLKVMTVGYDLRLYLKDLNRNMSLLNK